MIKKMNEEVKVAEKSFKVKDILANLHLENSNSKNQLLERLAFCCARYFYVCDQMDLYFRSAFRKEIVNRYLDGDTSLYWKFIKEFCRINHLDWKTTNRSYSGAQLGLYRFKGTISKNTNALLYLINKQLNPNFIELMDQCHSIINVLFGGQYCNDYISTMSDIRANITKIRDKVNGFYRKGKNRNLELKYKVNGYYIIQAFYNATLWYLKNNHYNNITDTKIRMHKSIKFAAGKFSELFTDEYDIETLTTFMESILDKGLGHVTKYTTYMKGTYENPLSDKRFTLIGVNERKVIRDTHILFKRFSSVINLDVMKTYGEELFSTYSNHELVNKLTTEFKIFANEMPIGLNYEIPVLHSESVFKEIPNTEPLLEETFDEDITVPEDDFDKDIPEVTYNLYFFTNKYINLSDIVDKAKYKIRVTTTERMTEEVIGVIRVEENHDKNIYRVISHNIELNDDTAYRLFRHYATSEKDLELDFDGVGTFKDGEFVREYHL